MNPFKSEKKPLNIPQHPIKIQWNPNKIPSKSWGKLTPFLDADLSTVVSPVVLGLLRVFAAVGDGQDMRPAADAFVQTTGEVQTSPGF